MQDFSDIENNIETIKEMAANGDADVLWITDFLIPRTTKELMERFKDYQKTGTRFYGFKIGFGESDWDKYFDKIYEIHYKQPRRY